ncbi:MAG TPA: hypothetical protein VFR68_01275 [Candidatus Dormibacteraeota bacterium]|nr:hypothetical protein [Candidatus Dormibacteraeota bacterium]
MKRRSLISLAIPVFLAAFNGASPASASLDPGVGNVPQGPQPDTVYADSFKTNGVGNVFATTQRVSCYRPEVDASALNNGPNDGYSGESACPGDTTGEDTGAKAPYATQVGSNPGFPMAAPQLVKDHSESDIRVDPRPGHANHLIASSKWIVSPEGYNHLLGFYESFDGGLSWKVQGHIPGYEGWTDNTDPIGEFDGFGNYYEFILPYQFFYDLPSGGHDFNIGTPQEPNPAQPAEVVSMAVRPVGSTTATQWITTHNGHPDFLATYDSIGNEPDKQWMTIDTNSFLPNGSPNPNYNTVYAMWVDFHNRVPVPFVSTAKALANGTHTDWSTPQPLPLTPDNPQGVTYLLPHVDPNGVVYTTLTNFKPKKGFCCTSIFVDKSTDGGKTWSVAGTAVPTAIPPPLIYPNTTFRDGIENTFAVGNHLDSQGRYPLYVAYEDFSALNGNVLLTASYDGGARWTTPIQVNDNWAGANPAKADEFQPNLTVAGNGTVSVNFYDRRLDCPASATAEAVGAGLALDKVNPHYTGSLPPYSAPNYCVNASIQFYNADLTLIAGHEHNIRLTKHTWDPQLNGPHPGSAVGEETFIGDYFGNITAGSIDYSTFTSTYNDTTLPANQQNPSNQQQQVIATVAVP